MRRETKHKRAWCRATILVEASFLIPWTVILLALLITMTFAIHNRTWYHAAALESALAGNQYVPGSGGNGRAGRNTFSVDVDPVGTVKAKQSLAGRVRDQAMPGSAPETQVTCTGEETVVTVSGQRLPAFPQWFGWRMEKSVKKVRPASTVRGAWLVREVWQTGKEEAE